LRYKTHIVSSLTAGAGLSIMLNYPFHIGYVIGICFGSLLPDIDEPRSFIGRRSFGLSKYVKQRYGHRGVTHSLFAWMLVSLVFLIYPSFLTGGISFGYLFHLIGDLVLGACHSPHFLVSQMCFTESWVDVWFF
jgi:inner membrane protein